MEIIHKDGVSCYVVFTKTIKGKPHPQGKVYKLLIPVDRFKK